MWCLVFFFFYYSLLLTSYFLLISPLSFSWRSFRKTGFPYIKPENEQNAEMRSRAGGNPSQGSQSVRNPCYSHHPPVRLPMGIPKITFSRFARVWNWVVSRTPSKTPLPLGLPKVPQEAQMSPKVIQNRTQNEVQKASKMENVNCEQNIILTMF